MDTCIREKSRGTGGYPYNEIQCAQYATSFTSERANAEDGDQRDKWRDSRAEGLSALLKTFYRGKELNRPVAQFFYRMPLYFSVGFRWLVGRLMGRSDERRSVALPLDKGLSHCRTSNKVDYRTQVPKITDVWQK